MNRKEERKYRRNLTLFVIGYMFVIMLVTMIISFLGVSGLIATGMIPATEDGRPDPQFALILMVVINLIVGLVVISVSSKISLKYVNRFISQMNRLASGDFKARLDYDSPMICNPSIRELVDSFNKMAEELENTKVLRGDFINNFSHEFKTPIVSIAGFAKLLKRGKLTEQQTKEYLDIIEEEALRLSAMATNVMNMTKVENQTILTDITKFNLSEQIRSSVLLLENAWTKKNIELSLEFDEYEIFANEELLKQIWINLLDNAIKFSPEYGMIVVKIIDEGENYQISVANEGPEIPQESQKKIFDKFYQADESHSSEGNGIGLAIVKRVVELHYGDIDAECRNGITTFYVELPKDAR
ncbi:MAG: ATP-binding protein [Bariatricus sp.]